MRLTRGCKAAWCVGAAFLVTAVVAEFWLRMPGTMPPWWLFVFRSPAVITMAMFVMMVVCVRYFSGADRLWLRGYEQGRADALIHGDDDAPRPVGRVIAMPRAHR